MQCLCKTQKDVKAFQLTVGNTPVPIGCGTAAAAAAPAAAPAPAATEKGADGGGAKKEKKEKPPPAAAAPAPAAAAEPLEPSLLDLRVGVITKCWNHPDRYVWVTFVCM